MTTSNPASPHAVVPAPDFCFVFVDLTTSATPDAMRPGPVLPAIMAALEEQVADHFGPAYGAPSVVFRVASSPTDRATNEIAINLRDNIPEQPTAMAYHQVVNGVPDLEVGVDLFSSLTSGQETLSRGISHEVLETLRDAGCNGFADRQDDSGQMDCTELCDFVQNTGYSASNGVDLSNFLLPSFWIPGSSSPWDYLSVMKSHYDDSNGYGMVAAEPTSVSQIGGERAPEAHPRPKLGETTVRGRRMFVVGSLTAVQRKRKSHPHARAFRRGMRF